MTDTTGSAERLGAMAWLYRTGEQPRRAERRELLRPLAKAHVANVVGRASMLLRLSSGQRAELPPRDLRPPSSTQTRTGGMDGARSSNAAQWVVAGRPVSSPAAA